MATALVKQMHPFYVVSSNFVIIQHFNAENMTTMIYVKLGPTKKD